MRKIMARWINIVLAAVMLLSVAGCTEKQQEIDGPALLQSILNQVRFDTKLADQGDTAALYFEGLPEGSQVRLYSGSGYFADELAMIVLPSESNGQAAMKVVENHISEVRKQFANYIPEEVDKIDHAVRYQTGKYLFVCITNDYRSVEMILEHADNPHFQLPGTKPNEEPTDQQTQPQTERPTDVPTVPPTEKPTEPVKPTDPTNPGPQLNAQGYPAIHSHSGKYKTVQENLILVDNSLFEPYRYHKDTGAAYASLINQVADSLAGKTKVYSLAIPTANGIVMPDDIIEIMSGYSNQGDAINSLFALMNENVITVNCYDNLMNHRNEYLYFRTDHHWNGRAAYYAYESFCATKGITPYTLDQRTEKKFDGFLGTLYRDTKNSELEKTPDTVFAYLPVSAGATMTITDKNGKTYGWPIVKDVSKYKPVSKYSTFAGGDNPLTVFKNPEVTDGSVCIIVKESFGNALLPYLVDHYSTIYEVDYRYWKGNIADFALEKGADDLIFANNMGMIASNILVGRLSAIIK